jgi:hypothetical protein
LFFLWAVVRTTSTPRPISGSGAGAVHPVFVAHAQQPCRSNSPVLISVSARQAKPDQGRCLLPNRSHTTPFRFVVAIWAAFDLAEASGKMHPIRNVPNGKYDYSITSLAAGCPAVFSVFGSSCSSACFFFSRRVVKECRCHASRCGRNGDDVLHHPSRGVSILFWMKWYRI